MIRHRDTLLDTCPEELLAAFELQAVLISVSTSLSVNNQGVLRRGERDAFQGTGTTHREKYLPVSELRAATSVRGAETCLMSLAATETILRDDQRVAAVDGIACPELVLAPPVAVARRRSAVNASASTFDHFWRRSEGKVSECDPHQNPL
jgi:hypothetical protein